MSDEGWSVKSAAAMTDESDPCRPEIEVGVLVPLLPGRFVASTFFSKAYGLDCLMVSKRKPEFFLMTVLLCGSESDNVFICSVQTIFSCLTPANGILKPASAGMIVIYGKNS